MGATRAEIEAHSRHVQLQKTSVEDITKAYTDGRITYAEKKQFLQEKAVQVNADAFGDSGYLHAVYRKTLEQIQKGMENLKEAATHDSGEGGSVPINIRNEAYYVGLAIWGQIQILNSIPTALGEVTGLVAERVALQNGASPATAKYIGIATDVGSNFLPVGMAAKATVRGGQAVARGMGKTAPQVAAAAKAAEAAAGEVKAARSVVEEAIDVSLKKEGVEKTVFSKVVPEGAAPAQTTQAAEDFVKKGDRIITPSGTAVNTSTGEVIESGVKVGDEFKVGAGGVANVRVSRVHTAEEIAQKKLGVPREQVSEMLQGWAPEAMAKGNIEEAADTFVKEMSQSSSKIDDLVKKMIGDVVNEKGAMSVPSWGQITEMYRNVLLAGPAGRARDMISNVSSTANYMAQRTVGAVLGDSTTLTGSYYYAKGMTLALHEAFDSAASAFARGGAGVTGTTRFDRPLTREIPGLFGDIVNTPTSLTVGIDRGFKTLNRRAALYAQELEASKTGGRAFDIQNVNLPTKEMWDKAVQLSEYVTFNNDLGKIGSLLTKGAQVGVAELYFPFMKTPINLMKYAWNNTPGLQLASGRLWDEMKAGGEAADLAMGRLTISNLFGFYISELTKQEMITGSGPADPKLRAAWLATHEPYSMRVGDKWVPLNLFSPMAQTIGMVADYTQVMSQLSVAELEQGGQAIMLSIDRNVGDNSWFRNMKDIVEGISEMGKSDTKVYAAADLASKPFVTMGTGGSAGAAVRRALDPETREARGIVDLYMSKKPGWSVSVPLELDGYGDPVVPPMAVGGRWAGLAQPVKTVEKPTERMRTEGDRLRVKLPYFGDSIGGATHEIDLNQPQPGDKIAVGITPQQKHELKSIYGNYLDHPQMGMNALMDSEEYKDAPDALKRVMFEGHAQDAKAFAEQALMLKHKDLGIKALQNDAAQYLPQLKTDEEKHAAQWDYKDAIDFFEKLTPEEVDNILKYTTTE